MKVALPALVLPLLKPSVPLKPDPPPPPALLPLAVATLVLVPPEPRVLLELLPVELPVPLLPRVALLLEPPALPKLVLPQPKLAAPLSKLLVMTCGPILLYDINTI